MLFRVKICGITTPGDARLAADAGADAIGLNFVAGSPRALDLDAFTFEGAVAPPDMDLVPWRSRPGAAAA